MVSEGDGHEGGRGPFEGGDVPASGGGGPDGGQGGGGGGGGGAGGGQDERGPEWLRGTGPLGDVVMSSRVRLARNMADQRFASRSTVLERRATLEVARQAFMAAGLAERFHWIELHARAPQERMLLVERHLISKPHARGRSLEGRPAAEEPRGVFYSVPDERLSIMVNEEDHLRIQAIRTGLDLSRAWADASEADDRIERHVEYAYSPRLGYLTACPTNVGTGLRMSVMVHLPALRISGEIDKVRRACADMNLAVRGFYGEGSEALGDLYQVSNQTTLGIREERVLDDLQGQIVPKIVEYERLARRELVSKRRLTIEDQVHRAHGLLQHARLLTTEEAMHALSVVRMGVVAGLVPGLEQSRVNSLILLIQPSHLQRIARRDLDQEQRRAARAALVRAELARDRRGGAAGGPAGGSVGGPGSGPMGGPMGGLDTPQGGASGGGAGGGGGGGAGA